MSLNSVSLEVPLAWLASRMFCFTGAGGLYHLVASTGALVDKAITETHRAVENDAGLLKGEKVFIAAVGRSKAAGLGRWDLSVAWVLFVLWGGALRHLRTFSILAAVLPAPVPGRGAREAARCTGRDR